MSPITRLLRSTAVNRTFTRSVPSRTASSPDTTSSSLFLFCSFGSGFAVCPLWVLRAGGSGAGFGLCAKIVQVTKESPISAVPNLIKAISRILNLRSSVYVTFLVIETPVGANQLYSDLAFLVCFVLIGWRVEENVLLPQVLCD